MKMRTSELTGDALDWAVELANGTHWSGNGYFVFKDAMGVTRTFNRNPEWRYSTTWMVSGPIIEKNLIIISPDPSKGWLARSYMDAKEYYGTTPLIAAMRCYVASMLGEEINLPDGLTSKENHG